MRSEKAGFTLVRKRDLTILEGKKTVPEQAPAGIEWTAEKKHILRLLHHICGVNHLHVPECIALVASLFFNEKELEALLPTLPMPDCCANWEEIAQESDWETLGVKMKNVIYHLLVDCSKRRGEEHMSMFARYADKDKVLSHFVSSTPADTVNAPDQLKTMLEHLSRLKVDLDHLGSMTLDSCRTNLGKENGLMALVAKAAQGDSCCHCLRLAHFAILLYQRY
jgi:hypothetical protein